MGVHDVRPKPAYLSCQRGKGTRIIGKTDAPSERRYPVYFHAGSTQVYVVSLVWPDETGVESLIKALAGSPRISATACNAGPPTFIRAMIRMIRSGSA